MSKVTVTDVFHQGSDDGIPAHWCAQYFEGGWAQYQRTETYEELEQWIKENAVNASSWV